MKNFYKNNMPFFDNIVYQTKQKSFRRNFLSITFCIIFALLFSFIIISALGTTPEAFFAMFTDVFNTKYSSEQFAVQLCIYIIAALAFSFSMKVGIFNIGISGQMLAGGSMAFLLISLFPESYKPEFGGQFITLFFSIIGATAVALVIGTLKIYFKVNEVVSAILLNWIILYIVGALIYKYNLDINSYNNGTFKSLSMDSAFTFWQIGSNWGWEWSIGVTVVCVIAIWVIMKYTVFGHKLKTTGQSPFAAQNFGYNKNALQLSSFAISGVLSGILAVIVYTASSTRAINFQSLGGTALNTVPTQGFDGIAIGLISLNNPLAIVIVSFIFTFPNVGSAPAGLPSNTIQLIVGIMMYIIAIYTLLNYFKPWRWIVAGKYEKQNLQNYMNFENSVFECSEKYDFEYKKIKAEIIDKKIEQKLASVKNNQFLFKFLKIVFLKPFYLISIPLFDKQFKNQIKNQKINYANNREKINFEFKVDCLVSLLDYWKHDAIINNNNAQLMQKRWKKDKNKIIKWNNEILKKDSEITIINIDKQFNEISNRFNWNTNKSESVGN